MIYLDNAATTLHKPQPVIDAVMNAMTGDMGNAARGVHKGSLAAARAVYEARSLISDFTDTGAPERVIFTHNATEALNIAINGMIPDGSHVITTDTEHNSVLRPLYRLRDTRGVKLSFVGTDSAGCIDPADFLPLITPETSAIVCSHASNLTGNIIDINAVGSIARENGLIYIVDASQTAGCAPLSLKSSGADAVCFSGHKGLMGPQGTGCLCLSGRVIPDPWNVGGTGIQSFIETQPDTLPERLEAGTLNSHGIAGLAAAVRYINEVGLDNIIKKERELTEIFLNGIKDIKNIKIYGDISCARRTPTIALNIGSFDSAEVADELAETYDIAVRAGAHCAPRMHRALGTERQGAVRFSFSWFTDRSDIEAAIAALKEIAG